MSSILIFGGNKALRKEKINNYLTAELNLKISENNPDLIFIVPEKDKKSIGINVVKDLAKYISERPMSNKNKAVVIEECEILTEPAQNSLLKVLEEHPNYCYFILGAKNEENILETVVSRCKKINLSIGNIKKEVDSKGKTKEAEKNSREKEEIQNFTNIEELIEKRIGERLVWAIEENGKEREDVIEDIENMIMTIRNTLQNSNSETNLKNVGRLETLAKVKKDLIDTNVTLKLALEYIAVKL